MKKKNLLSLLKLELTLRVKISLAKKLILEAKKCGVNAVKFQLFRAETLASKKFKKTKDQERNIKKEKFI